jgi:hypothetical protein
MDLFTVSFYVYNQSFIAWSLFIRPKLLVILIFLNTHLLICIYLDFFRTTLGKFRT